MATALTTMSTRANIVIRDAEDELIFCRHSDGYPEGTLPTLERFLDLVKAGEIRDNVSQAAGWLILIWHKEYEEEGFDKCKYMSWKVRAYEPTTCIHGDIEYFYVIDRVKKTVQHCSVSHDAETTPLFPSTSIVARSIGPAAKREAILLPRRRPTTR